MVAQIYLERNICFHLKSFLAHSFELKWFSILILLSYFLNSFYLAQCFLIQYSQISILTKPIRYCCCIEADLIYNMPDQMYSWSPVYNIPDHMYSWSPVYNIPDLLYEIPYPPFNIVIQCMKFLISCITFLSRCIPF